MPATFVEAILGDLDAVLQKYDETDGTLLLLFLGDRMPSTGRSWCPDCVRAEPEIYKQVERQDKKLTLVTVNVGDRVTWRDPDHPLRRDPRFELKGVPTLMRWHKGKAVARLEDYEAHVPDRVRSLVIEAR